jgi:glycerate 2-kinase
VALVAHRCLSTPGVSQALTLLEPPQIVRHIVKGSESSRHIVTLEVTFVVVESSIGGSEHNTHACLLDGHCSTGGRTLTPVTFRDLERLTDHGRCDLRRDALTIAAAGLSAADPAAAFTRSVNLNGTVLRAGCEAFDLSGRDVFVVGAGKATIGIAAALDGLLGSRIRDGAVAVKHGQARPLDHIEVLEAAHPVPDGGSAAAGDRLLAIADMARPGDLLIAIFTGGSSALAVAPADGLTLADKVATGQLLLASGADIVSMNNVRKHLSRLKGGRLGAACRCTILNFSVSDVVGDPPHVFTNPTVPDPSSFADAREACDRFGLWDELPPPVAAHLRRASAAAETVRELADVHTHVLATSTTMCSAALAAALQLGYAPELLTLELEGDSAAAGRLLARSARALGPGFVLVAGGETVVALGLAKHGLGGPSQEAAVAAAIELSGGSPACALCLDSDGSDGPTDAAGGIVDDLTVAELTAQGVDPSTALAGHATYDLLADSGDLVVTGPTGTNVNDLRLVLTGRSERSGRA